MGRDDLEGDPVDQTVPLQPLQRLGQHPLTHAADLAAQLAEAVRAVLQGDQHQHAPAAGHMLQDLARGAGGSHQVAAAELFGQGEGRGFHTNIYVRTYEK